MLVCTAQKSMSSMFLNVTLKIAASNIAQVSRMDTYVEDHFQTNTTMLTLIRLVLEVLRPYYELSYVAISLNTIMNVW